MISNKTQSIKRLLLKIGRYIGISCYKYLMDLFTNPLTDIELEILEKIFTMGLYGDEVIDAACFTALCERIFTVEDCNIVL